MALGLVVLVVALYAGVAAFNKLTGASVSATGIIGAAVYVLGAGIYNTFIYPTYNGFAMLANFIGNVFHSPVAAVKVLFFGYGKHVYKLCYKYGESDRKCYQ